jgi:hypothetical protein
LALLIGLALMRCPKKHDAVANAKNARLGKPGIFNFSRCKVHHCPSHGLVYTLRDVSMMTMVIPELMTALPANGLADWPVAHLNPQI